MSQEPTWFGDPEIDDALRGEVHRSALPPLPVVPEVAVPTWAPRIVEFGEDEPTVTQAMQPPRLQIVFESPDGVRPVHQTFQGAFVDPDIDVWVGENNVPPTGEKATMTRIGG